MKTCFSQLKYGILDQGYDQTLRVFEESLEKLRLDYLDLYLVYDEEEEGFSIFLLNYIKLYPSKFFPISPLTLERMILHDKRIPRFENGFYV